MVPEESDKVKSFSELAPRWLFYHTHQEHVIEIYDVKVMF